MTSVLEQILLLLLTFLPPITVDLVVVANLVNKIEQFVNDDEVLILLLLLFNTCLELVILIGTVVHDEALNDADRCTCNKGVEETEDDEENPEENEVGRIVVVD